MGCDIHGYIEYENYVMADGNVYRSCFGENLGDRDYAMFGLLAGVRHGSCMFEPRGIPEGISFPVKEGFYLYVVDEERDSDRTVTKDKADEWVSKGFCTYLDDKWVTHPDWHTPSWLTCKEYEQVLRARELNTEYGNVDQEWYAILAAMKALKNSRFVFWFDN